MKYILLSILFLSSCKSKETIHTPKWQWVIYGDHGGLAIDTSLCSADVQVGDTIFIISKTDGSVLFKYIYVKPSTTLNYDLPDSNWFGNVIIGDTTTVLPIMKKLNPEHKPIYFPKVEWLPDTNIFQTRKTTTLIGSIEGTLLLQIDDSGRVVFPADTSFKKIFGSVGTIHPVGYRQITKSEYDSIRAYIDPRFSKPVRLDSSTRVYFPKPSPIPDTSKPAMLYRDKFGNVRKKWSVDSQYCFDYYSHYGWKECDSAWVIWDTIPLINELLSKTFIKRYYLLKTDFPDIKTPHYVKTHYKSSSGGGCNKNTYTMYSTGGNDFYLFFLKPIHAYEMYFSEVATSTLYYPKDKCLYIQLKPEISSRELQGYVTDFICPLPSPRPIPDTTKPSYSYFLRHDNPQRYYQALDSVNIISGLIGKAMLYEDAVYWLNARARNLGILYNESRVDSVKVTGGKP